MIQKIKKTRAEVLTRINCIQSSPGFESSSDMPPSYEQATSVCSSSGGRFKQQIITYIFYKNHKYNSLDEATDSQRVTYKDLATALQELSVDPNQHLNEELVYSHPGVRLYFISPNGEVMSAQEPQLLKISLVEGIYTE